jgi:hypothetical protein
VNAATIFSLPSVDRDGPKAKYLHPHRHNASLHLFALFLNSLVVNSLDAMDSSIASAFTACLRSFERVVEVSTNQDTFSDQVSPSPS